MGLTEGDSGDLEVLTDTSLTAAPGEIFRYAVLADRTLRLVGTLGREASLTSVSTSTGVTANRVQLAPIFEFDGPEAGPPGGRSTPIRAQRDLSVQRGRTEVWREDDKTGAVSILARRRLETVITLGSCKINPPLAAADLVKLDSPSLGRFYAIWLRAAKGSPPLAISLHGGPSGFHLMYPIYANLWALKGAGFQYLDVNYAGSSMSGRVFRSLLDQHPAMVARETVLSAVQWARARSALPNYRPLLEGTSYGAYLGAWALIQKAPISGAVLSDGPYAEKLLSKKYPLSPSYKKYWPKLAKRWYSNSDSAGTLVESIPEYSNSSPEIVLNYAPEDDVVPARSTAIFADALRRKSWHVDVRKYTGAAHGDSSAEFFQDANSRPLVSQLAAKAGNFVTSK